MMRRALILIVECLARCVRVTRLDLIPRHHSIESPIMIKLQLLASLALLAVEHDAAGNTVTGSALTYASSNDTIVTATPSDDGKGVTLLGVAAGVASVTVSDAANNLTRVYDVTVAAAPPVSIDLVAPDGTIEA